MPVKRLDKDNNRFIVSVVGKSGSGKTTLLKKLISALTGKNYRVGTVKHCHHFFEIDKPGKDSWQHREAGAVSVMVSSGKRFAFIKELDEDIPIREMIALLYKDIDIVLIEGYKNEGFLRIEVARKGFVRHIPEGPQLLMAVSDAPLKLKVPVFSRDEIPQIADLLIERMHEFYQEAHDGSSASTESSI